MTQRRTQARLRRASPMNKPNELKGCPLLAGIPPEELRRDCPTARVVAIRHRGTIYRQGEPGRTVFCVLDGQVTIARVSSDGATLTTAALGPGDFFGPALSGAAEAEDTARAKGAVSIWRAPIHEWRNLLLHHPHSPGTLSRYYRCASARWNAGSKASHSGEHKMWIRC